MLKINEIFGPTIQGEGRSLGRKVIFLRLSLCNLHCVWCDTKYTWDWENYDKTKEIHLMSVDDIFNKLSTQTVKSLVISGGEPLLQQKKLLFLIKKLKEDGWWIEIETNGTIAPLPELLNIVDQFNCSPKLSNNIADTKEKRLRNSLLILKSNNNTYFKFVVGEKKDLIEIKEILNTYQINPKKVYLMPLGKTKEELELTTCLVERISKKEGFLMTHRLHIELFGQKRGV